MSIKSKKMPYKLAVFLFWCIPSVSLASGSSKELIEVASYARNQVCSFASLGHNLGETASVFSANIAAVSTHKVSFPTRYSAAKSTQLHSKAKNKDGGDSQKEDSEEIEIPAEFLTRKLIRRNPDLLLSTQAVLRKLKFKDEVLLVDIRNSEVFNKFRIPGSINIPLFAIKTKAFLKSKKLILVNEGQGYRQLERECIHLRDLGFRAWILNGGLNYWRHVGAPLQGDVFAQKKLNKVSPQIFFEEKDYENWVIIDVSAFRKPEADYLFRKSIPVAYSNDPKGFISEINKATRKYRNDPYWSILVTNETGDKYERIENVLQKMVLKNLFFLEGGMQAYRRFLEQQALIWQRKNNPKVTTKKCVNCP